MPDPGKCACPRPDPNSAVGKLWPADRLEQALAADYVSLVRFLQEQHDARPTAGLDAILDDPDATERNRSSIRTWRDAERTCAQCPGLRVCGSTARGNPWPRLTAVRSVSVEVAGKGPVLALAWDLCALARADDINPRVAPVDGGSSRVWVRHPAGEEWSDRGYAAATERPKRQWQSR